MPDSLIDNTDRQILAYLAEDARMSLKVLSANVGLSSPSTAERIKRLEERGIIEGYGLRVNLAELGFMLQAMVRVKPLPGMLHKVEKIIQAIPECVECDKITGDDCFIMRLVIPTIKQLDEILDELSEYAQSNTSIVKSSPVKRRLPRL